MHYIVAMTETYGFTLFDTAIGRCGIAWGPRGIRAVSLPEKDDRATRARLLRKCPGAHEAAAPATVQGVIDGIVALIRGEAVDFSTVELDMPGMSDFARRVYAIARTVPAGSTITYGEIAARLGVEARDVGQTMGQNPCPVIVPCHRVVAAGRKAGGFSAPGGVDTKLRLLAIEGAQVAGTLPLFESADRPR
jgi:methylated-DNA-[protein]-cysteine S-methyltransferase